MRWCTNIAQKFQEDFNIMFRLTAPKLRNAIASSLFRPSTRAATSVATSQQSKPEVKRSPDQNPPTTQIAGFEYRVADHTFFVPLRPEAPIIDHGTPSIAPPSYGMPGPE